MIVLIKCIKWRLICLRIKRSVKASWISLPMHTYGKSKNGCSARPVSKARWLLIKDQPSGSAKTEDTSSLLMNLKMTIYSGSATSVTHISTIRKASIENPLVISAENVAMRMIQPLIM